MNKALRILAAIFFAYIVQTTVLTRFTMLRMQPDILLCVLVVLTLDGDRYKGFCAGAVTGLLMDAMVGQLPFLYIIIYPLFGYSAARISPALQSRLPRAKRADKPSASPKRSGLPATLITVALLSLFYETILLVYRYLNGVDVTLDSIGRMLQFALSTTVAAFFVRFYVRFCLAFPIRRGGGRQSPTGHPEVN